MFLFVYNFKPINIMKKLLLIIFFLAGTILQAQIKKGLSVSISYGITNPIQDYRQYQFADDSIGFPGAELFPTYGYALKRKGGKQFNIDASYRFGAFGMGLSFGQLSHQIESFDYNIDFPHQFNGGDFSATYYGVGPDYSLSMGKLDLTSSIRAGMMKSEITKMYVDYTGNDFNEPVRLLTTTPVEEKGSSLAYASVGIKLSYPFGKHLSLFVKSDLFTTLGKGIEVKDVYYQPFDVDRNEDINAFDVEHFTIEEFKQESERFIKPQMFNVGVGLTYTLNGFGKSVKPTTQNRTRNDKIKDFFAKKRIENPDTQPLYSNVILIKIDKTALRQSGIKVSKTDLSDKRSLRTKTKKYRKRRKAKALRASDRRIRTDARTRTKTRRYRKRRKARALRASDRRIRTDARTRNKIRRYKKHHKVRGAKASDGRSNGMQKTKNQRIEKTINKNPNHQITPSNNLDKRFISVKQEQIIKIEKGNYQLSAPKIKNKTLKNIKYTWEIKHERKIIILEGTNIETAFDKPGSYEIKISPNANGIVFKPFQMQIIID